MDRKYIFFAFFAKTRGVISINATLVYKSIEKIGGIVEKNM